MHQDLVAHVAHRVSSGTHLLERKAKDTELLAAYAIIHCLKDSNSKALLLKLVDRYNLLTRTRTHAHSMSKQFKPPIQSQRHAH